MTLSIQLISLEAVVDEWRKNSPSTSLFSVDMWLAFHLQQGLHHAIDKESPFCYGETHHSEYNARMVYRCVLVKSSMFLVYETLVVEWIFLYSIGFALMTDFSWFLYTIVGLWLNTKQVFLLYFAWYVFSLLVAHTRFIFFNASNTIASSTFIRKIIFKFV